MSYGFSQAVEGNSFLSGLLLLCEVIKDEAFVKIFSCPFLLFMECFALFAILP